MSRSVPSGKSGTKRTRLRDAVESSNSNSGSSAAGKASGTKRTAKRGASSGKAKSGAKPSGGRGMEMFGLLGNCLGIVLGVVLIGASAGFYIASGMMVDVLDGIKEKDLSKPLARLGSYTDFFDQLATRGYDVQQSPVVFLDGIKTYQWRVEVPNTGLFRIFRWKFILEDNAVLPETNPALVLDVHNGLVSAAEAEGWKFDGRDSYDPDDDVTQSILADAPVVLQIDTLPEGWTKEGLPSGPVGAPLISVEEAMEREKGDEEEIAKEQEERETEPGEVTEVGGDGGGEGGGGSNAPTGDPDDSTEVVF